MLCEVYDEVKVNEKVKFDLFVVMSYEICMLLNGIFGVLEFLKKFMCSEKNLCFVVVIEIFVKLLLYYVNNVFDVLWMDVG